MKGETAIIPTIRTAPIEQRQASQQAANDKNLIRPWLHGRSPHTQAAYRRDVAAFLSFVGVDLYRMPRLALQI